MAAGLSPTSPGAAIGAAVLGTAGFLGGAALGGGNPWASGAAAVGLGTAGAYAGSKIGGWFDSLNAGYAE